jgi:hypothetical protein
VNSMIDVSWMLPESAFNWIEKNISFGSTILEFGSGHGSTRLAKNYTVYSIEHDEEWLDKSPAQYIHAPIIENKVSSAHGELGWYDPARITPHIPEKVDLIIIDGPNGTIGRTGIIGSLDLFDWSGLVLVDDIDREAEYNLSQEIARRCGLRCIYRGSSTREKNERVREFAIFQPFKFNEGEDL